MTNYGPKTYKLVTIGIETSHSGIETPAMGTPHGELMTRQEAESHCKGQSGLTYYNVASL